MKRSKIVRRILLGGLSAGALTAATIEPRVSPESFYPNDYHLPGAGYYHAPFRAFFPLPYNHYDAQKSQYYYGGQWGPAPHRSIVNISPPTPAAAQQAEAARTDTITRGGFGSTSRSHFIHS